MRAPMEAAAAHLPPQPPMNPTAPGPFAFADSDRLRGLLAAAGFEDIDIAPFDVMIGGGDIAQTTELAFRVGPLGAALRESPQSVDAVGNALRALYQKHLTKEGVLMPAAVWIVRARPGR
jgi:3',5'-cyclic AMP phosphodiesterase CpdA